MTEQNDIGTYLGCPLFQPLQSPFDPVSVSMHQQDSFAFTLQQYLPRHCGVVVAIAGNGDDLQMHQAAKLVCVLDAVAEMDYGVHRLRQAVGLQCRSEIAVGIGHHQDFHEVSVAEVGVSWHPKFVDPGGLT